jgi:hypothetical protein
LIFNDDWQSDAEAAAFLTGKGLSPKAAEEAAIFSILPPGNYTAILAGKNAGGIGLVEVYNIR